MMLAFSLQRIEVEADISDALKMYPNDGTFDRFKLEFVSILKNTKWDAEVEENRHISNQTDYQKTPEMRSGSKLIFNVGSSNEFTMDAKKTCYERYDTKGINSRTTLSDGKQQSEGYVPVYNINSSGGNIYPTTIVLSTAGIEQLSVEPPIQQQRTIENDVRTTSGSIINIGKAKASGEIEKTCSERRFDSLDVPKFVLGISPEKENQ